MNGRSDRQYVLSTYCGVTLLSGRGSKRSEAVRGAGSETGESTVESFEKVVWALSLAGVSALTAGVSVELVDF